VEPPDPREVAPEVIDTVGTGSADDTVTGADICAVPPAPVHCSENVLFVASVELCSLPDTALAPTHAPDAVHVVAFVELHVRMVAPLVPTVDGLAAKVTVGKGAAPATVMIVEVLVTPPAVFEHVRMKVVFVVKPLLVSVPLVAFVPVQPPAAVQLFASEVDHVSVVLPGFPTEFDDARSETVGCTTPELALCLYSQIFDESKLNFATMITPYVGIVAQTASSIPAPLPAVKNGGLGSFVQRTATGSSS
jgi:hypothetical protein